MFTRATSPLCGEAVDVRLLSHGLLQSSTPGRQSRSKRQGKSLMCYRENQERRQEDFVCEPIHKAKTSKSKFSCQTPLSGLCVDVLS